MKRYHVYCNTATERNEWQYFTAKIPATYVLVIGQIIFMVDLSYAQKRTKNCPWIYLLSDLLLWYMCVLLIYCVCCYR